MKLFTAAIAILLLVSGCTRHRPATDVLNRIAAEIDDGNLTIAMSIADSLKGKLKPDDPMYFEADSLREIAGRIGLDYNQTKKQFMERLMSLEGAGILPEDLARWRKKDWINSRVIDGDTMYFNRAATNLIRLRNFREEREYWNRQQEYDLANRFYRDHITAVLADSSSSVKKPVKMIVTYTVSVQSDAVPAGELIRCWLPWPRPFEPRQTEASLVSASQDDFIKSPSSSVHSTVYMERKAVKGHPTEFSITYSYESSAVHFPQGTFGIKPYETGKDLYKTYTAEQLPQVHFSPEIQGMAEQIAGGEKIPSETVRKIWLWFKENVPWTGAMEYSTMKDIPGYTCSKLTGDCGMQTLLFISMLRSLGIPARWQSGWMVAPGFENLHDWCEVWYEDAGWVPVDISFSMPVSGRREIREFYLSGLDSYRMIINNGIAGKLYPEKKFLRSDPYDFQRGEVEWKGGNLYFDKWDYDIKIEYNK